MTTNGVGPNVSSRDGQHRFDESGPLSEGGMTYNPTTDTYTAIVDSVDASVAVARGLADVRQCEVTDLAPLNETVDPDALDRLVESSAESTSISLAVDGFEVRLIGGKFLEISAPS